MADNVAITAGSGTTIATDDVGGVQYQRVKPAFGADGAAADVSATNGLPVAGAAAFASGSAAALNADVIASTDVSAYRWVAIHITATFSGTLQYQVSNDNSNWVDGTVVGVSKVAGGSSQSMSSPATGIYLVPVLARYMRLRVSAYTSGTVAATVALFTSAWTPPFQQVLADFTQGLSVAPNINSTGTIVGDANSGGSVFAVTAYGYAPSAGSAKWDRLRIPNIFKTAAATASGNSAVWTPASGRKFRLMRYRIEISGDATISGGGVLTVKFQDATTDNNIAHSVYVPAVAANTMEGWQSGWIDLGNGPLSAAANNVLNVNLSAALASGTCRVLTAGTEE